MTTDEKLTQISHMLQSLTSENEKEVLDEIKNGLQGMKLSKQGEEPEDGNKLKQNVLSLRKKNIDLKRRLKEVSESLINDNPNPTQEELESMDVKILTDFFREVELLLHLLNNCFKRLFCMNK